MAPSVSVGIGLSDLGSAAGDIGGNCVDIVIVPRPPEGGRGRDAGNNPKSDGAGKHFLFIGWSGFGSRFRIISPD
jgi:hypothetical protein